MRALDPPQILEAVAQRLPASLQPHVVVVGSIASAWAFRELAPNAALTTKDIDLLLRPAVAAAGAAQTLAEALLAEGWQPHYPTGVTPADESADDEDLPALRLRAPGERDGWFIELMAEPAPDQVRRRAWRRFKTPAGHFGLPSYRYLPFATHDPEPTPFGLRVAHPANMALAHLLEHADPDETPMSSSPAGPGFRRYEKDLARAVSLWWLSLRARPRPLAARLWQQRWLAAAQALNAGPATTVFARASLGAEALRSRLLAAHTQARASVLAGFEVGLDEFRASHHDLLDWLADGRQSARPQPGDAIY